KGAAHATRHQKTDAPRDRRRSRAAHLRYRSRQTGPSSAPAARRAVIASTRGPALLAHDRPAFGGDVTSRLGLAALAGRRQRRVDDEGADHGQGGGGDREVAVLALHHEAQRPWRGLLLRDADPRDALDTARAREAPLGLGGVRDPAAA